MSELVAHFTEGKFEKHYWIPAHNTGRDSSLFRENQKIILDASGVSRRGYEKKRDREVVHVFEPAFRHALSRHRTARIFNATEPYNGDYIASADIHEKRYRYLTELSKTKKFPDTPDDVQNLVVLCRELRRLKDTGIPTISFPLWLAAATVPSRKGGLNREPTAAAEYRKLMKSGHCRPLITEDHAGSEADIRL